MTITTINTKTHLFQIEGEVKQYKNIKSITENEKCYILKVSENWEYYVNKEFNKIINVF